MSAQTKLIEAIAQSANQPAATFDALYLLADELIGAKLFTLSVIDNARRIARRMYSNMPEAYPVQGTKTMHDDPWSTQVLVRHEIFVSNSIAGISEVFSDYDLILSLGCEAVLNIPIVVAGKTLGTINCLHEKDHYTPERISLALDLKIPGTLAFLLNNSDVHTENPNGQ